MSEYIIETQNLNFSYSKSNRDIEELNLQVPKGSIYGFLGPNGSGKSTSIRLLLGLLKKESGTITLFGNTFENNRIETLSKIGALIENPSLYGHLNAIDNLRIAANYKSIDKSRIDEVLEIVKLTYAKNKKVAKYSLGMKQRLGIATALLSNPEILILDEPTNGLDPKGIIEMRALIKTLNENYGTTIFISSHLLSEIEKTCSHVGIIRNGKMLFQNTVKALKKSQSDTVAIDIETSDSRRLKSVIAPLCIDTETIDMSLTSIILNSKDEISALIDEIRKEGIDIYQITIKNNLEDLFLTLTEK
ncbi:ABC-type multidrug transport system, ATPase component [Aequorivita sublithincola DSM 14238]|uniref:ABC-type multidrug transport system, ATPase component n=1 Tax=Aequorivita sublithincola (strain DSM 14238 / LMG 21431 / ACAM 643 / 9-3) TaxID=746697 RepID=I3Z018_AEQSU|nr:ATP-binding cassette domain-containing protein [Aequorivita sublithincola]AFL82586.1 ABC-type multidrug transport system, ATPase component [Aequorivita sublithincola DSM 14238]